MYCAGTNWRPAAAGRPASRGGAGTTRLSPHELPPLRQFISSNATQIIINQDILQLKLSWMNLRRILFFNNDFKSYLPFPHDLSQPFIFFFLFPKMNLFGRATCRPLRCLAPHPSISSSPTRPPGQYIHAVNLLRIWIRIRIDQILWIRIRSMRIHITGIH